MSRSGFSSADEFLVRTWNRSAFADRSFNRTIRTWLWSKLMSMKQRFVLPFLC